MLSLGTPYQCEGCEPSVEFFGRVGDASLPLFKPRALPSVGGQERLGPNDPRAFRQKAFAQFRRKEGAAVCPRIEFEQQSTVRRQEPCPKIMDKELPIHGRPFQKCTVVRAA